MGFLNRIFRKQHEAEPPVEHNRSFVECVDLLYAWKLKTSIDPDIVTPDDSVLNSAFESIVRCPYCSNDIVFRDAVINTGMAMRIRCPVCKIEPSLQHTY